MTKTSPLAPKAFPKLPPVKGVKLATIACGIKYKNRDDVLVAELTEGTSIAGVLTTSATASASVLACRKHLMHGKARVLVVNAGNANTFNGSSGEASVKRITECCKTLWRCNEKEIYTCATGVIGVPLKDNLITDALPELKNSLSESNWEAAARAITTTDTFIKGATGTLETDGKKITINGFAKGSGMIAPNMATMLGYIFTDANIEAEALQAMLSEAVDKSFNSITVDSDTSTSDTVLCFATGQAGNSKIKASHAGFQKALDELCLDLAQQIVKDGEGATKFITIEVRGAVSHKSARAIGLAIANSPLVKTAIAGEDANWGRIVMAIGKSGEEINAGNIDIKIGGVTIVEHSELNPAYNETEVTKHMKGSNIGIAVDVGMASGQATVYTCDLTHEYISINADYRS